MSDVEILLATCGRIATGLATATAPLERALALASEANEHDVDATGSFSVLVASYRMRTSLFVKVEGRLANALRALALADATVETIAAAAGELGNDETLDDIVERLAAAHTTLGGLQQQLVRAKTQVGRVAGTGTQFRLPETAVGKRIHTHAVAGWDSLTAVHDEVASLRERVSAMTAETARNEDPARHDPVPAAAHSHQAVTTWGEAVAHAQSLSTTLDYVTRALQAAAELNEVQLSRAGKLGYRKVTTAWEQVSTRIGAAQLKIDTAQQKARDLLEVLEQIPHLGSLDDIAAALAHHDVVASEISDALVRVRMAAVRSTTAVPLRERSRLSGTIRFKLDQAMKITGVAEGGYAQYFTSLAEMVERLQEDMAR